MELTPITFLIVCPLVFLGALVDAIGGGGGLITLPAYILAGVPVHMSIGTNKLSSMTGTCFSTFRLCRNRFMDGKIVLDLQGTEREAMTVEKLIEKFEINNDRMLL